MAIPSEGDGPTSGNVNTQKMYMAAKLSVQMRRLFKQWNAKTLTLDELEEKSQKWFMNPERREGGFGCIPGSHKAEEPLPPERANPRLPRDLATIVKNELDSFGQTLTCFFPRLSLTVSPGNLRTVCDEPLSITLEHRRELVPHQVSFGSLVCSSG